MTRSTSKLDFAVRTALTLLATIASTVAIGWLTPAAAHAQDGCAQVADTTSAYNQAFDDAIEAYGNEDWDGALALLAEAEAICAVNPQLTYQRGRVYQRSGDCASALRQYEQANVQIAAGVIVVSDALAAKVTQRIGECSVASLTVTCTDDGVQLRLDDRDATPCPRTWEDLEPGEHTVVATRVGAEPWRQTVDLEAAASDELAIPTLGPVAETPTPDPVDEPPATTHVADTQPRERSPEPPNNALLISGSVVGGAGIAALAAGILIMTSAVDDSEEVRPDSVEDQREAWRRLDDAEELWDTGLVVTGVGGGLLAVGVALIVLDLALADDDDPEGPTVGVGPTGASISVRF